MSNISNRSDNSQLPSFQETKDLRGIEAKREVPKGTKDEHFVNFSSIIALLKALDLPTSQFDKLNQGHKITDKDA